MGYKGFNAALRLEMDTGAHSALFLDRDFAEAEALVFIEENPETIVMLVQLELGECKHCNLSIVEKAGWVLHKWMHVRSGAYLCWSNEHTKAEPKEEDADGS